MHPDARALEKVLDNAARLLDPPGPSAKYEKHGFVPTPTLMQFEGYGIGAWSRSNDGSTPPEAVVLHIDFGRTLFVAVPKPGVETITGKDDFELHPMTEIGLRLKTRRSINVLIVGLEEHRDAVFPLDE